MNIIGWLLCHSVTTGPLAVLCIWLIGQFFAYYDGWADAVHFDRLPSTSPPAHVQPDVHQVFAVRRAAFFILLFLCAGIMPMLSAMLCFPFVHDGRYYAKRNDLNNEVYRARWREEPSETSTAIFDLSYQTRKLMLFFGVVLLGFSILIALNHG